MTMKVFFATNRNELSNGNGRVFDFGKDLSDDLQFGIAKVKIKREWHELDAKVNDGARFKSMKKSTSNKLLEDLEEDLKKANKLEKKCSVLVFIPGFNNLFEESIEGGALLAHLYSTDAHKFVPFVFSWPSNGNWLLYTNDKKNAELSGLAAADAFRTIVAPLKQDGETSSKVSLVAHSLGAYVLRQAVQKIERERDTVQFSQVILPAADEDPDALEQSEKLQPLLEWADEVVVYTNEQDLLLNKVASNSPRMGKEISYGKKSQNLTVVHCLNVAARSAHRYYRESLEVVDDIATVLRKSQKFNYRNEKEKPYYKYYWLNSDTRIRDRTEDGK